MNSRILNSFKTVLSLTAASSLMTGCIFGENKQFFQTGTPVDAIVSGVSGDSVIDLDTYTDPTPSPTATPSGTPDHMSTPTPTPTATPDPSPSATPTATPTATPSPSPTATPTATPSPTATPVHTALAHESFVAARSQVKKLDFLFVVDNSGSMADNQARLADGFEAFANAFYRRADLDICTAIITTDRYLGRTNSSGSYSRERVLPCTKPAGSENWSQAQTNAYIDSLIAEFRSKINVGTNGSGTELTGKSLVTYLHNANKWADGINVNQRVSFFRADAVSNVSIVTDENNWYYSGAGTSESSNDIPVITNATIWNSNSGAIDARKGIKNYLDGFFTGLNPGQGLSYSVTTFLELTKPATSVPGISKNLDTLAHLVGRESASADIAGSAQNYANVYSAVGTAVAIRAAAFNLAHDIYEPLFPTVQDVVVKMVRASDGAITTLSNGSDYAIMLPNGIVLNQAVSDAAAVGDQVTVDYRYQTP